MILVDTSIWIELLSGRLTASKEDTLRFVTCGPVLQEVLQGLRETSSTAEFVRGIEAMQCLSDPIPRSLYREAASIYRQGRRRGLTIRSSVDCLIAAIGIAHNVPVWHRDRDFDAIASYTTLEALTSLGALRASHAY